MFTLSKLLVSLCWNTYTRLLTIRTPHAAEHPGPCHDTSQMYKFLVYVVWR